MTRVFAYDDTLGPPANHLRTTPLQITDSAKSGIREKYQLVSPIDLLFPRADGDGDVLVLAAIFQVG